MSFRQYNNLLKTYLAGQWGKVFLLAVLLFGGIGLEVVIPQIQSAFIDAVQAKELLSVLIIFALSLIAVALVYQIMTVMATYLSELIGWQATNQLRLNLLEHCLTLDMSFHHTHLPGEMIDRIDGDVTALSKFFTQFVIKIVGNMILIAAVVIVLLRIDWRIGLSFFLFALLLFGTLIFLRDLSVPAWKEERQGRARLYGFLEEHLSGMEDIRANGGTTYVMRGLYKANRLLLARRRRAATLNGLTYVTPILFFGLGSALAYLLGAFFYRSGSISIGVVYLLVSYQALLITPIQQISTEIGDFQQAAASILRIQELFSFKSNLVNGSESLPDGGPLAIAFDHVVFGYLPDELVLKDISFQCEPGRIIGLLGRTGSGKTTITRLLGRLYDPLSGSVMLGGKDLRLLDVTSLRQRVAMVPQEVHIFHASLRDNLTLFDRTIPDARILQVIDDLELRTWYDTLPSGLDTEMSSSESGLSAGELQLVAFARVFLKPAGLVIMDEASSRLDGVTERLIDHAMRKLVVGRTVIIIAHRLASVERADDIIILEQGNIVEQGRRKALEANEQSRFVQLLRSGLQEVLA